MGGIEQDKELKSSLEEMIAQLVEIRSERKVIEICEFLMGKGEHTAVKSILEMMNAKP